MTMQNEELIVRLEKLKDMLTARATGGDGDDALFKEVRKLLVNHPQLSRVTPDWIKSCRNTAEFWGMIKPQFETYQERRNWLRSEFEPIFDVLEAHKTTLADESIADALRKSGSAYVHEAWQKALARREQDPDGAITTARTLLEEVCRFVLDEIGDPYNERAELPALYTLVSQKLKLAPSQHSEQVFKQILSGCHSVVQGLGALRSRVGDAHAKGKIGVRAVPRHAAFAVNIAGATASFILETYEARKTEGTLVTSEAST